MIRPLDDLPAGILGFEAVGKVTAADYRDVLVPAIQAAAESGGKIRIVLVFSGEFDGMEVGAVWQDLKLGVRDWSAWERIAVVTDHGWLRDGVRLFAWAVPGQVATFGAAERDQAIRWAASAD